MTDPIDLDAALAGKSAANLDADSLVKIRAAGAALGSVDAGNITLGFFAGSSPWERHIEGDELLFVLEGEVGVTLLHDDCRDEATIASGSIFVVPRGRWHRTVARQPVKILTNTGTLPGTVSKSRLKASPE